MRHTHDMTRPLIPVAILAIVLAACAAGGTGGSPPASPSPVPSLDEPTPEPTASPEPDPSAEPTPQPSPTPGAILPLDTVVATAVEGLNLRRSPGVGGERLGFLELGTIAYLLEGPIDVEGVPWYRITGTGLPYASGCITIPPDAPIGCPAFLGWVAGANAAGDPWLVPGDAGTCPEPTLRAITDTGWTYRLICFGDDPITFEAYWPGATDRGGDPGTCDVDAPGGWLYCESLNPNGLAASPEEAVTEVVRLVLSIEPGSGVTMPARDGWIRVTGRFDHPDAAACADLAEERDRDVAAFRCRIQFVPTSVEAVAG